MTSLYHYSNPKFAGKPWAIDEGRKKKKKRRSKKHRRHIRNLAHQKKVSRKAERNSAAQRCKNYLRGFWLKFSVASTSIERLGLLKQAANPGWERVTTELRVSLRREFARTGFRLLDVPIEECGVGCGRKAEEKHHIVPLYAGGINDDTNLVMICLECHDEIHPWMKQGGAKA